MEDEPLEEHALALGGTGPALMLPYVGMPLGRTSVCSSWPRSRQ